jgi:hypothetical protein
MAPRIFWNFFYLNACVSFRKECFVIAQTFEVTVL